jgi:REP element-mobilizing transposase RayT
MTTTTFYHRYHLVWAPKYRFQLLHSEVWLTVREIIKQVCSEMGVTFINSETASRGEWLMSRCLMNHSSQRL